MDSDDGKEKGGVTAVRKGEAMKSLEKATADYEKAKEKMEASKARYEADLKRFKAAEIAKTEAENLEIVRIIRAMDMSIPELEAFKKRMKNELPGRVEIQKEETRSDDEFREDETEEIFSTNSFLPKTDDAIKLDDLIEMKNHFRLFDYMLDNIDAKLSKSNIIEMNKILKRGTSDEDNPRYNVGGFKIVPNKIGLINVIDTSSPKEVDSDMTILLDWYNSLSNVSLEDIIEFHVRFERIHPFGDGNGRVGRMIMFKECLKNNIVPFIILDKDKSFYMRGLKEYKNDKMFLIDAIKNEQDIYEKVCNELLDFNLEKNEKNE